MLVGANSVRSYGFDMQEIVIGTGNPAKKKAVQAALAPLGIAVLGTDDLNLVLDVLEDGATAQENARKKSLAYARALGRPGLHDNALYMTD
jgi:inosine/xanthosine triphosphate pyrophosphatase family protein